jgi:hypothetical protein
MPRIPAHRIFYSSTHSSISLYLFIWEPVKDRSSRNAFVITLCKCLAEAASMIVMVAIYGTERKDIVRDLGDLSPLLRVCNDLKVPFRLNTHPDDNGLQDELEIRILCKSVLNTIRTCHLIYYL